MWRRLCDEPATPASDFDEEEDEEEEAENFEGAAVAGGGNRMHWQ